MKQDSGQGYIIEFHAMGRSLKVTAVDPHTFREVSIVAPVSFSRDMLARQAVKKLLYVLRKGNAA